MITYKANTFLESQMIYKMLLLSLVGKNKNDNNYRIHQEFVRKRECREFLYPNSKTDFISISEIYISTVS